MTGSCPQRGRQCSSPEDTLIRWGGDEFLVIAPGLSASGAADRIRLVRTALAREGDGAPPFTVSVGTAALEPGGEPSQALKEADQRMYADKRRRGGEAGEPTA